VAASATAGRRADGDGVALGLGVLAADGEKRALVAMGGGGASGWHRRGGDGFEFEMPESGVGKGCS
jgi:hypothetical protein